MKIQVIKVNKKGAVDMNDLLAKVTTRFNTVERVINEQRARPCKPGVGLRRHRWFSGRLSQQLHRGLYVVLSIK